MGETTLLHESQFDNTWQTSRGVNDLCGNRLVAEGMNRKCIVAMFENFEIAQECKPKSHAYFCRIEPEASEHSMKEWAYQITGLWLEIRIINMPVNSEYFSRKVELKV